MLRGRGNTGSNIVCPLHRWTYDLQGQLIGAPHFADDPCLNLPTTRCRPGTAWCSSAAAGAPTSPPTWPASARAPTSTSAATCSTASSCTSATTTGRPSSRSTSRTTTSARSTPGSASFVTCEDLRWEFGRAPLGADGRARRTSSPSRARPAYRKWHDAVLAYRNGVPPEARRDLAHLLPDRDGRVVPARAGGLDAVPARARSKTLNVVEFFYPEEIAAFEREFVEAAAGRVLGNLRRGRRDRAAHGRRPARRCIERGDDEVGPYQSPMEDGMQQFHEWYRASMALSGR